VEHLETEGRNPASADLDERTPLELVRLMNAEDARVPAAVATQAEAIARAVEVIADWLRHGGRLVYLGAGTSGRLGVLDAAECPPTFSSPPGQVVGLIAGGPDALTRAIEGAEDDPGRAREDLAEIGFSARDVLVGIATSGRTPYVLGGVDYARSLGAFTIGLACNSAADLTPRVDLAIVPVVGPEVLSGSTRLKAGTATKLVLNMLTTGAMVRLGKTFGNLMVDLRATNSKLRDRTNRIVRQLTGLGAADADALLARCDGELKTALVAQLANLSPAEARARLSLTGGRVKPALGPIGVSPPQRSEQLVLGIDGGGTHTVALLAEPTPDGWAVRGRGEAGPSNLRAAGTRAGLAALDEAVARAFAAANLPRSPVATACLGLAGADREAVEGWARSAGLAGEVEITTDVDLLLAAGTPEGWGLAVVAGTGSIAFGCTSDGRSARAGGWGPLLGDEGSAHALALEGLRAVAHSADGVGPETVLTEVLLREMGLREPHEIIPVLYGGGWDRSRLASLAPLVIEAAGADRVADSLVGQAASQLATATAAVGRRLGLQEAPVPLALAGGLLLGSEAYRGRFLEHLRGAGIRPDPVGLVKEPADGAVRRALRGC
jgi:N-acetylmuramic acid 6-phosphate etherase